MILAKHSAAIVVVDNVFYNDWQIGFTIDKQLYTFPSSFNEMRFITAG